jgi:hypothetical protein
MIKVGPEDQHEFFQSFIYAHGELEKILHNDLISATEPLHQGITEVIVGVSIEALAFVWQGRVGNTGLVVLKSDKESCRYALECYLDKVQSL